MSEELRSKRKRRDISERGDSKCKNLWAKIHMGKECCPFQKCNRFNVDGAQGLGKESEMRLDR